MDPKDLKAALEAVARHLPLSFNPGSSVIEEWHEGKPLIYHQWTNHTPDFYRFLVLVGNLAPLLLDLWEKARETHAAFCEVMSAPLPPEEEPMDLAMQAQWEALMRLREFQP